MQDSTKRWLRVVGLVLLGIAILVFMYFLRSVFNGVLVGFLIAYVLSPLVDRFEAVNLNRVFAVVVIYAAGLLAVIGVGLYGSPIVMSQLGSALDSFWGEEYSDLNGNGRWDGVRSASADVEAQEDTPTEPDQPLAEGTASALSFQPDGPGARASRRPAAGRHAASSGSAAAEGRSDRPAKAASEEMLPAEPFFDANGNGRYDPGYLERMRLHVDNWITWWNRRQESHPERMINRANVTSGIKLLLQRHFSDIKSPLESLLFWIRDNVYAAFGLFGFLVLVPIYTFFFLLEMHRMTDAVVQRVPLSFRPQAVRILAEIQQAISSFFRGRVLICMIDAALSCVAFYICGVRFWFLLGLVTGALGIVPIVGPIAAFVPTAIISVIDYGLVRLLVVTLCFWGVQALDGLALTPLILGAKVRLHPVTLIISLLVGGHLFGVFGVLAAVPVVCILKILGKEFVLPQLRMALSEAVPAPPAGGSETP